jgi:hypothetical protein
MDRNELIVESCRISGLKPRFIFIDEKISEESAVQFSDIKTISSF